MIEEFVILGRKRETVANEALLDGLRSRGFEPQIVGEIDPPPKNGGSWVLKDKRDRRVHEDGGVWISWQRSRDPGVSLRYVVETFDGRSGWDWFLSCAVATAIAVGAQGKVSVDGSADKDTASFTAELAKDPTTDFQGPESVVDWESKNLDEEADDEDEDEDDAEDEDYADSEEDDDEDEEAEAEDSDADDDEDDADDDEEDDDE